MKINEFVSHTLHGLSMAAASLAVLQLSAGQVLAAAPAPAFGGTWSSGSDRSGQSATPIKHVIVIIGENRSFDHMFATYIPKPGQTVHNLLSEASSSSMPTRTRSRDRVFTRPSSCQLRISAARTPSC
jgi:phospholipase C